MRGLCAAIVPSSKPSRSAAATLMLWTRTSAVSTSRSSASRRRAFQIEHDTLLVAVDVEEVGAHPRMPRRPQWPNRVALRWLDLENFGAHVAEDLCRHRSQYR